MARNVACMSCPCMVSCLYTAAKDLFIWNSLPNEVVEVDTIITSDTINILRNRLEKFWPNQEIFYDFNADLTGTGDLPICI